MTRISDPGGPSGTLLTPGTWVRHPDHPEWGPGQVQSAVGERITVTFENAGKQMMRLGAVSLDLMSDEDLDRAFGSDPGCLP